MIHKNHVCIIVNLLFMSAIMLLSGCVGNSRSVDEDNEIELVFNGDSLSITDEFDSVELVRLDNKIEALLTDPLKMIVNDASIIVLDKDGHTINAYDHEGAFINKIGRKGHGRGELTRVYNCCSNTAGDTIAVLQHNSVSFYSGKGAFLGNMSFGNNEYWDDILLWNGNLLLASYHRNTGHLFSKRDLKGNVLANYVEQPNDLLRLTPSVVNQLQQDEKTICFYDYPTSTFYLIDKNTESIKTISLKSNHITSESQVRESNAHAIDHDHFTSYTYDSGIIRGNLNYISEGEVMSLNSKIDTQTMDMKLMRSNGRVYDFMAAHDGCFYSLLPSALLMGIQQMDISEVGYSEILKILKEAAVSLSYNIQETDNFYLLKMKIRR